MMIYPGHCGDTEVIISVLALVYEAHKLLIRYQGPQFSLHIQE